MCELFGDVTEPYAYETEAPQPDLDDIICVLSAFAAGGDWVTVCPRADLLTDMGNCTQNGTVDLDDILAELGAFGGSSACSPPCQ